LADSPSPNPIIYVGSSAATTAQLDALGRPVLPPDGPAPAADAVVFELGDDQVLPVELARQAAELAPFAQIVCTGPEATVFRLRQKLLLIGGLTDRWSFVPTGQPDAWGPALAEAAAHAGNSIAGPKRSRRRPLPPPCRP